MRKRYILLVSLVSILLIMIITNPKQDEYVNWATQQITEDKGILVSLGANQLGKPVINASTKTSNFLLFSLYETKIPNKDQVVITIGLFNQFIN